MLVLCIMYSKRQRRPNVRLEEIGDVPAAFHPSLTRQRWRRPMALKDTEINHTSGLSEEKSSECTESDFRPNSEQNRENKNPNSSNGVIEFEDLDEEAEDNQTRPDFTFTNVTRKCRARKRRGRSKMNDCDFFHVDWTPPKIPESTDREFKAVSDNETPTTSKEGCDYESYEPCYDPFPQANFSASKEDACCKDLRKSDVSNVSKWLEEKGFGRYALLFEMHEVDEQVLPLLTTQDLKEIGVLTIGPRRKLYTAIQKIKGDVSTK